MDDFNGLRRVMAETPFKRPDLAKQLMDIASNGSRTIAQRDSDMAKAKLGAMADATYDPQRKKALRGALDMYNSYDRAGLTRGQRGQMMGAVDSTFGLNNWTGKTMPPNSLSSVDKSWENFMNPSSSRRPIDAFNDWEMGA
jgi:hypothetical protein